MSDDVDTIRDARIYLGTMRHTAAYSRGEKVYTQFDKDESLALLAALDRVAAERVRLEEVLREIAEWQGFTSDCCDCMEDVVAIARAALAGDAPR